MAKNASEALAKTAEAARDDWVLKARALREVPLKTLARLGCFGLMEEAARRKLHPRQEVVVAFRAACKADNAKAAVWLAARHALAKTEVLDRQASFLLRAVLRGNDDFVGWALANFDIREEDVDRRFLTDHFPALLVSSADIATLDALADKLNITAAEARARNYLALEWAAEAGLDDKIEWFFRRYGFVGSEEVAQSVIRAALRGEQEGLPEALAAELGVPLPEDEPEGTGPRAPRFEEDGEDQPMELADLQGQPCCGSE
jgi:hypothetical protein